MASLRLACAALVLAVVAVGPRVVCARRAGGGVLQDKAAGDKVSSVGRQRPVYYIYGSAELIRKKRAPGSSFLERLKRQVIGEPTTAAEEETPPEIRSLSVATRISSRFAQTVIHTEMVNPLDEDAVAAFKVRIPEVAFMSNFTMVIDDELYVAEVKSKEEAEEDFEEAQRQNKTAGMVGQEADYVSADDLRGMERFVVSINVAAGSSVQFTLTYQELLERRNGLYEHRTSIRPGQIVPQLLVEVNIYEPQGITSLDVIEPFQGSNSLELQDTEILDALVEVKEIAYRPSEERQQAMDEDGVVGDFIVRYDVNHGEDAGLIRTENDYFVHFFSPSNLEPLDKNIIFVIDISGSMSGKKIDQTREAMLTILDQLRAGDTFMLLLFDDKTEYWPSSQMLVPAHGDNIQAAKVYVEDNVIADGSTNLHDGLVEACNKLRDIGQYGSGIIVLLTDGQPSAGITSRSEILSNVGEASAGKISIFSLGFGFDLDYDLVQAVSFRNNGFARRIYIGVDADVQLENFYEEINTPVIYDVKMIYDGSVVDTNSLTKFKFPQYFAGSELVVAGKLLADAPSEWECQVTGVGRSIIELNKKVDTTDMGIPEQADAAYSAGFLEKLYIYMKIKDLLRQEIMTDNAEELKEIRAYALQLALDYHLVTPLTSFIVVQNDVSDSGGQWGMADAGMALGMAHVVTSHPVALSLGLALSLVAWM